MGKPEGGGGGPGEKNENLENSKTVKVVEPEKIRGMEEVKEKAPEGWMTNRSLTTILEVSNYTIDKLITPFRNTHPEWFREYLNQGNKLFEHYHPDLIAIVKQKLSERAESAPEGWMTNTGLRRVLGISSKELIQRIADPFRSTHPEWFKNFLDKTNKISEHLHPDLVETVKQGIKKRGELLSPEGWITNMETAAMLDVSFTLIKQIAEPLRASHPEWFKKYLHRRGITFEHYHPDLVTVIKQRLGERGESAPEGWMTKLKVANNFGTSSRYIDKLTTPFRNTHPEWLKEYLSKSKPFEHYHPDLIATIKQKLHERGESAPEGWITNKGAANLLKSTEYLVNKTADLFRKTHPEWFEEYLDKSKRATEHYAPDLLVAIRKKIKERSEMQAPEGWMTKNESADNLSVGVKFISTLIAPLYSTHPEWFEKYIDKSNQLFEYYHPNLVALIKQTVDERVEEAPEEWMTKNRVATLMSIADTYIQKIAGPFHLTHPEWFKEYWAKGKGASEYYHPDLIATIKQKLHERGESAPEGWITKNSLMTTLGVSDNIIDRLATPFRSTHPEWFKEYLNQKNKLFEHYSPNLIVEIKKRVELLKSMKIETVRLGGLESNLQKLFKEIGEGKTPIAQQFQSLTRIFGSSRCLDLLYKFRPEYKGLPTDYVKGVLADYLGDFLVTKGDFKPADVDMAVEYLSDLTFQEGLYETIKDNCLRYYFDQKRTGKKNSQEIIYGYLDHLLKELGHLNSKALDDIIQKVIIYYDSVLRDFHKPTQFVEALSNDREFPDINQRINMKELSDKKRLLIADEMGLGKSASVIMAKEQLGVRCALIVAPSNVLDTWENYLLDENEGGYYKTGQAPKVLRVENPEDLKEAHSYNYILISQERLNERYTEQLKKIDYDMLVVDEAHKLKGLEGTRTQELLPLAAQIQGENKYLALLSGTPVPNKIEDLAFILRLLYPDKFTKFSDSELVYQIIYGDIVDLRSLLLPRMQMKSLEEGVEMPDLSESTIPVELSSAEKEAYEVLLEEDELTASEKMVLLRKFLLNSDAIDATPGIESSKIKELDALLAEAFKKEDRVAVFVNDYMEDIIRGDTDIIRRRHLPPDVVVRTIHGEISQKEREKIQLEFNESSARILLVVSGQTADVGVDLSGGEHVIFYNEPWTEYQKHQELGRVYRPGLAQALKSETLVAKGTIEQGIHEYIQRKYQAVEKLLRGIPITELEKELIAKDEKSKKPDLSVNPELAAYYFSSWDKLMKIFGYIKEIGEKDFKKFLAEYAGDYANCYQDLGSRSYQANANRVAGTLINEMVKAKEASPKTLKILDLASGPEMLKQHVEEKYQEQVFSLDINREHFTKREKGKQVVGSLLALPFAREAFDFANLSLSLHYTKFAPSKGTLERLQVIMETNRVLKVGGRAVIGFIYSFVLKDTEKFREAIESLGFRLVDEYSGEAVAGDRYRSHIVTLEKVKSLDPAIGVDEMNGQLGKEKSDGLKFEKSETKLKDSRRIITSFELAGQKKQIQLNQEDQLVWQDEQQAVGQGEFLKKKYGSIENIPRESIITNNFVRLRIDEKNKKYILFKKLAKNSGVVVVK